MVTVLKVFGDWLKLSWRLLIGFSEEGALTWAQFCAWLARFAMMSAVG